MLKTPMYDQHLEYKGQMVDYAGWELPIKYETSIRDEHIHCRTNAGMFDVSHMGRFMLKGKDAARLLERVCSRRIGNMQHGQCRYTLICNEHGGVKDDAIVLRMDDREFMFIVNGANRTKILEHIKAVVADRGFDVKVEDRTEKTAMIALQGPKAMELISKVSSEVPALKKFRFTVKNLMILKVIISRTGYTGEDGVEVILPASAVPMALKMLMKEFGSDADQAIIKPCGLGARDTLRLEAAMPLYGHELGEDINALAVGMGFAISLDKSIEEDGETFIGQEALIKTRDNGGPDQKLVGIVLDAKRTARQDMPVLIDGQPAGKVTSGCMSPTLEKSIAMAYVDAGKGEVGAKVQIDAGRHQLDGEIVALPFYKAPEK